MKKTDWRITTFFIITVGILAGACQLIDIPTRLFQIGAGWDVGTPSLPYYAYTDQSLDQLNAEMEKANLKVTLADTYRVAYQKNFSKALPSGDTGQRVKNIQDATVYFQRLLAWAGMPEADKYILTTMDSVDSRYTLFAAVYRPIKVIAVRDKYHPEQKLTLTPMDRKYYRPYRYDIDKNRMDVVYEWSALPRECYQRQADQALLLALAANQVLAKKIEPEYWEEEQKWMENRVESVLLAQDETVCRIMGIDKGFMEKDSPYHPRKNP